MKIAVLILAHKNLDQLNRLIRHLATDFDVYVHIDKKSKIRPYELPDSQRVFAQKKFKISWGSLAMVKATLALLGEAHSSGYDRYILISGQDLPLKSNRQIQDFFQAHKKEDFISTSPLDQVGWSRARERLTHFHFASATSKKGFQKYFFAALEKAVKWANDGLKINRTFNFKAFGGSQWFNLCDSTVAQIVGSDLTPKFMIRFRATYCPDEMFFQSLIGNLNIPPNIVNDSLRYIDWSSGPDFPRTLTRQDRDKLEMTDQLFARKFDETVDLQIIESIYKKLRSSIN